jgi:hypothetical protein
MYEFHAWVGLSDSTVESDHDRIESVVAQLIELIGDPGWSAASFAVPQFNGQYFFVANGSVNRRRDEAALQEELLAMLVASLPGSWGLVHERDDAMPFPPGPNAFRTRVVARGAISERADPFLTPINPTIED